MNIIDKIKLIFYPELKNLNIDDEILKQIISNKNFKTQYKTNIKPFIKKLQNNNVSKYDALELDEDTIKYHLRAVFELSIKNNSDKYISFLNQNDIYQKKTYN